MVLCGSLTAGLGPWLMGASFDATQSYKSSIVLFGVLVAVSLVIISFLPRYRIAVEGEA